MEEYYLISAKDFDETVKRLFQKLVGLSKDEVLKDESLKLIDLSDEAIAKKAKIQSFAFTCKNGETFESRLAENYYSSALKDLKQTLNETK